MSILIISIHPHNNARRSSGTHPQNMGKLFDQVARILKRKLIIFRRIHLYKNIPTENTLILIHEEFLPQRLSWWHEPEELFRLSRLFAPELIHMIGLDFPLYFRWLRKYVGEKPYILGQYTGEQIWPNIRIWMQQFGFRAADGFLIDKKKTTDLWLKRALILPRQDIYKIKNLHTDPEVLSQVYQKILGKE